MSTENEVVGTVVLTVDGREYDCDSIQTNKNGKWKPVATMNRDGRTRKKARQNKSQTLSVSVVIPDGLDDLDWENLTDARLTIESLEGGFRETYIDCNSISASDSYQVEGETRRTVEMFALDYVKESV